MAHKCPYCEKEVAARGRKNHVRLMTGDGHAPKGEIPDSFENDVQADENGDEDNPEREVSDIDGEADSDESEADTEGGSDAAEVTADEIGEVEADAADEADEGDGENLPFDPDSDEAIELDGDEDIYVRHGGEVVQADVEAGDWLLVTDSGPVLYDADSGDRFEVVTA